MSDDDETVYQTKHKPVEPETPRKEALRELAKLASHWRERARDYAKDGNSEQANFQMEVALEIGFAQDYLAERFRTPTWEEATGNVKP